MEREYVEDYEERKTIIINSMNMMESSPSSYQDLLPDGRNAHVTRLKFHDSFESLVGVPQEGVVMLVNKQQEELRETIKQMKEGVEKLFDEDFNVSQMFHHLGG
ncbi:hypothetical protein HUG15_00400 [Salicibibacter cibarius]|uniref:Uncharacterized protein n=1 Tax=Salicibibacter cibarius TaxID=2743000 RepID=A0A7T6YZS1_9BACI|nr:hypothetical protein [Salicibibacter cibarius]QQK74229.1 hypothetical protein HUG15_00400 [Salicibibacter cibarius]